MFPQVERGAKLERVITALQAMLEFLKPFESPAPWTELEYFYPDPAGSPAWARTGNQRAESMKAPMGWVSVRGNVIATTTLSATIAVLPAGMRPPKTVTVPAACFAGGARQYVSLDVQPNGRIVYIAGPALVTGVEVQMNFSFSTRV